MIKDVTPPESSPLRSIQEIFLAARDMPSGEQRDRYLDEVIGDDPDRRRRVELMLASQHGSQRKPLERAIEQLDLTAFDATTTRPTTSASILRSVPTNCLNLSVKAAWAKSLWPCSDDPCSERSL